MTVEGIVVRGHGKSFVVRSKGKEISCEIRGKLKYSTDSITPVAVGDDVVISENPEGTGMIEEVKERRSMFFRPAKGSDVKRQVIAANIDQLAVVSSVREPELKPGLIDRFLIASEIGGLKPVVVINKIDLGRIPLVDELLAGYSDIDIPVYITSAVTGEGLESFEKTLNGHRTILAGHSGVGKSTILNRLLPDIDLKVKEVSHATKRGVHTTSLVELFELRHGGFVVDSPGLKVLALWEVEKENVSEYFPEIFRLIDGCRFTGCSHTHEPDCAVKEAVDKGMIPEFRYKSYVTIYNSL
ncbi:MAG: ribosome small subunit-dependent GTPase A [Candidatus Zixiibacteriota bacterium]|nr:MAG: ribosome small subunit-dependent GTPase A [candidate division Zixibacteria bacterium]